MFEANQRQNFLDLLRPPAGYRLESAIGTNRVRLIKTREQARQYLAEVQKKIRQRRAAAQPAPGSI